MHTDNLKAFSDHLDLYPDDWEARSIYADCLEEAGDDIFAEYQRGVVRHKPNWSRELHYGSTVVCGRIFQIPQPMLIDSTNGIQRMLWDDAENLVLYVRDDDPPPEMSGMYFQTYSPQLCPERAVLLVYAPIWPTNFSVIIMGDSILPWRTSWEAITRDDAERRKAHWTIKKAIFE